MTHALARCLLTALVLLTGWGCAATFVGPQREPLRLSEVSDAGDPTRRASLRLVDQGLAFDSERQPRRALSQYERAIQVDPNNPFAYLALARHHVETGDSERGLAYLDRAERLLDAEGLRSPRVEPHLLGLRGAALAGSGRADEGGTYLGEAGAMAPVVWGDERLAADELR